jgi:hypothetical protein
MKSAILVSLLLLLSSCAGDIKGEAGKDASAVSLQRPGFQVLEEGGTVVTVPASESNPAKIEIDETVYTNTADTACDLRTLGRTGIDAGVIEQNEIYYLYGIPNEDGETFDLVASTAGPTSGPSGFTDWSYIGAFPSAEGGDNLDPFLSRDGRLQGDATLGTVTSTLGNTWEDLPLRAPITAFATVGAFQIGGGGNGKSAWISGFDTGSDVYEVEVVSGATDTLFLTLYQADRELVYMKNEDLNNSARWIPTGWVEDPVQWP